MRTYVARKPLEVLGRIDEFVNDNNRFPTPSDFIGDKPTLRGAMNRSFKTLQDAGLISRKGHAWENGTITSEGHAVIKDGVLIEHIEGSMTLEELANTKLSLQEQRVLFKIRKHFYKTGTFPGPNDIVAVLYGRVTNHNRSHMIDTFRSLESGGYISRSGSHHWNKGGRFTDTGLAFANTLSEMPMRTRIRRRGGGLSAEGGTRFPDMLFSVNSGKILQAGDTHSKLGAVVSRANGKKLQLGLPIVTFSLEEGRTCSLACGLRERCFAGKMSRQKRILYEGQKTDVGMAKAILLSNPSHYRINTVGDIPTQSFLEALLAAITVNRSTAFGYTHWQPEDELGAAIRNYSDAYWNFFSIRTSYEHGSREPLRSRAAVVLPSFDPGLLKLHNAVPCPENLQRFSGVKFKRDVNCGNCGLCWTLPDKNIAFIEH